MALSVDELLSLCRQIASALAYMVTMVRQCNNDFLLCNSISQRLVHCDVAARNCLLHIDNTVKVLNHLAYIDPLTCYHDSLLISALPRNTMLERSHS